MHAIPQRLLQLSNGHQDGDTSDLQLGGHLFVAHQQEGLLLRREDKFHADPWKENFILLIAFLKMKEVVSYAPGGIPELKVFKQRNQNVCHRFLFDSVPLHPCTTVRLGTLSNKVQGHPFWFHSFKQDCRGPYLKHHLMISVP